MFDRFKRNQTTTDGAVDDREGTTRTAVVDRDRDGVDDRDESRLGRDDRTAVHEGDRHPGRGKAVAAGAAGAAAGAAVEHHHDRKVQRREALREDAADAPVGTATATRATAPGVRRHDPVLEAEALATMRERQRARYGGASWGAAFFGFLSAVGLAAILAGILTAAGAAIGISQIKDAANAGNKTIGLGGGILLLIVLAIAWYCGGYVAGRMARFDGARQGFAVWVWTILFVALVAVAAVIGGNEYDVAGKLNLPSIPTHDQTWTTGGAIAAVAALVVTLLFAILGGKAGDLFHRRVDRVATAPYEETV
jgi:hypothetical protein